MDFQTFNRLKVGDTVVAAHDLQFVDRNFNKGEEAVLVGFSKYNLKAMVFKSDTTKKPRFPGMDEIDLPDVKAIE